MIYNNLIVIIFYNVISYHDAKCEFEISSLTHLLRVSENRKPVYMKHIYKCMLIQKHSSLRTNLSKCGEQS